ncbi:MAG TPA: hypothetical protein VGS09_07910 [Actinomycetota bacterium]|nr:hypothetical protein [Actinomycetota bacterium]
MEILFFLGFIVLAIAAVSLSLYLQAKRRQEFFAFAQGFGFEYSRRDPFGLLELPFHLFTRGDGRGIENVLWGQWKGQPVKVCDYWYYEEHRDSEGRTRRTYHRFNCAALEVDAAFPPIVVGREGLFSRLADHLGFRDIEFESEEFNRRFQVRSGDRRFAYELVDARMMRWLLALERSVSFEVVGRWILAYHGRVRPEALVPLIGAAAEFRDRIPRAAWGQHGIDQKEEA